MLKQKEPALTPEAEPVSQPKPRSQRRYLPIILLILVLVCLVPLLGIAAWLYYSPSLIPGQAPPITPTSGAPVEERTPRPTFTTTPPSSPAAAGTAPAASYRYRLSGNPLGGPSCKWTGFAGMVRDAVGNPLADIQVGIWDQSNTLTAVAITGPDGQYRRQLAEGPLAGIWTLRILVEGQPASEPYAFRSDDNCQAGLQRFQVNWEQIP
jgi:hypothetical protein